MIEGRELQIGDGKGVAVRLLLFLPPDREIVVKRLVSDSLPSLLSLLCLNARRRFYLCLSPPQKQWTSMPSLSLAIGVGATKFTPPTKDATESLHRYSRQIHCSME